MESHGRFLPVRSPTPGSREPSSLRPIRRWDQELKRRIHVVWREIHVRQGGFLRSGAAETAASGGSLKAMVRSAGAIELPKPRADRMPWPRIARPGFPLPLRSLGRGERGCSWGRAFECIFVDKTGDVKFKEYSVFVWRPHLGRADRVSPRSAPVTLTSDRASKTTIQ